MANKILNNTKPKNHSHCKFWRKKCVCAHGWAIREEERVIGSEKTLTELSVISMDWGRLCWKFLIIDYRPRIEITRASFGSNDDNDGYEFIVSLSLVENLCPIHRHSHIQSHFNRISDTLTNLLRSYAIDCIHIHIHIQAHTKIYFGCQFSCWSNFSHPLYNSFVSSKVLKVVTPNDTTFFFRPV